MPRPAVPPAASSFGGNELLPDQLAICGMGRGPADIPPVHPAVAHYRQTNWRQGDNIKIKKLARCNHILIGCVDSIREEAASLAPGDANEGFV